MYDEADYQDVGDAAPQGGRQDERLVFYSKDQKEGAISTGDNTIALLPPFPNYEERYKQIYDQAQAEGKPFKLPIGHFFRQLTIGVTRNGVGKANFRNYRFKEDNHVTDAFRALHEAKGYGKMDEDLKKLQRAMGGYGDWRFVVNVLLASSPNMVRVMNLSSNNPRDGEDQRKKLASHYIDLVRGFFSLFPLHAEIEGQTVALEKKPLFDPHQNVPLTVGLEYNGDIPQPGQPKLQNQYSHGGNNFVSCISVPKILSANGVEFSEEMLSYAEEYANTVDELPDLTDIKGLMESGWACDVLGLGGTAAQATRTQSQGASFSGGEAPPSSGAPSGPPPGSEQQSSEAPPSTGSSPDESGGNVPGSGAGSGFSTFDQKGASAADAFKAQLDAQRSAGSSEQASGGDSDGGSEGTAGGYTKDAF